MRLNKRVSALATTELLEILRHFPEGRTTSELTGTRTFHGERTLTGRQVARLLRATGKVREYLEQGGAWSAIRWRLEQEPPRL